MSLKVETLNLEKELDISILLSILLSRQYVALGLYSNSLNANHIFIICPKNDEVKNW